MSVVGIDFGTTNCTIAAAQKGGVDILTNEVSSRTTPSLAAFAEKERFLGEPALTQYQRNIANTITDVKLLIGRKFDEKEVQEFAARSPYKLKELPNKEIGVEVMYAGEKKTFSVVAITAMILQKMRDISTKGVGKEVKDVVISIPSFWTDAQRRAFLDASRIGGLNALRLIHDNTATALQYGIYKTNLPEKDPLRVMFIDMGSNSTQVSIVDFLKGQLKVVGTTYDRHLGGRSFDKNLVDHFAAEFKEKYKIDVNTNRRAYIRLEVAAEKLKKLLNTVPEGPINIESIMNDIDVKGMMKRADFETLSKPLLDRLEIPIRKILEETGTKPEQLGSIEITGGATRLLAVQAKIQEILKRDISKTTNHEESVSRGCALQCAILSPLFKVRDFAITDVYHYPVKVSWSGTDSVEVFSLNNVIPSPKQVTIDRNRPTEVRVEYSKPELLAPAASTSLGKYNITLNDTPQGDAKIRVKVKLDLNGIINMESAQLLTAVEEKAEAAAEKAAQDKANQSDNIFAPVEGDKKPEDKAAEEAKKAETKKVKLSNLGLVSNTTSLSEKELNQLAEEEAQMAASDRLAVETADRKNQVEAYVYAIRGKLHDQYSQFSTESEKEKLSNLLDNTENWLYEDGADVAKSVYVAKLAELHALGEPIARRFTENENRYEVLAHARTAIENIKMQATSIDPKYDHIEQGEKDRVSKEAEAFEKYLHDQMIKQDSAPKHADPVITAADIQKRKADLEKLASSVLNKPKPRPKVEEKKPEEKKPEEKKPEEKKADEKPADASANADEKKTEDEKPKSEESPAKDDKMDLD